jgi:hypothetical protein
VTVARDPGPIHAAGGPLLGLLGLLGLVALCVLRIQGTLPLDPDRRRAIVLDRDRRRFEEWISEGTVPPGDSPVVRMDSLPDLVDVAIDSDRRVIESEGRFYVLLEEARYVFDPKSTSGPALSSASVAPGRDSADDQPGEGAVEGSVATPTDSTADGPETDSGSPDDDRLTGDGGTAERDASTHDGADAG